MKLKFRADAKDWTIFAIFCVVLLYFVAIAVLNLSYFATYSKLWGLNPFPAFTSKYIIATLVGFVGALAAVIASVSSYFFDREEGIGFSTDAKKEKGYSRWASDKEFQEELDKVYPGQEKSDVAGIPLCNNGKEIWVDAGEYHNLIIGSTGSGKTQIIVQPMVKLLAKKGESMIITDPKGEIYEKNAVELREKGYNVVLLNFRNPQQGNSWNPLTLPYRLYKNGNKDKANELLDDLAANILYDEKAQNSDPFWEKTSADYFTGLALGLFEDATEEEINLNSINLMTTIGEDKCGPSTYIKEYFSFKEPSSPAYINVSSTLMAPSDTKSSILSVFKQKIKLFSSRENLSEMLGHSDFDMSDIGRKKTAVFIVIQDEKKTYHSLVTIFLKQCYETLIDVAQENGRELPYKTNFILDEFANMPPLKDVTTMVTAARSRAIRFTFIIQNFAQLYQVYGKENGETIKGNCGNIIYLISSELGALEEISKMCGEVKSKDKDKTASTPLVTVSDLQRLPMGNIIVLRTRMMPYKTKMKYNWQMEKENAWGKNYDAADYPQRDEVPVALFDIKSFVDAKKDEKINQMLSNMSGNGGNQSRPQSKPQTAGGIDINDFFKNVDKKLAEMDAKDKKAKESKPKDMLSADEKKSIKDEVAAAMKPVEPKKDTMQEEVKKAVLDEKNKKDEQERIKAEQQKELAEQKQEAEKKRIAEKEQQEKIDEENKKKEQQLKEEAEHERMAAEAMKKQQEQQEKLLKEIEKQKEQEKALEEEKEKQQEIEKKQREKLEADNRLKEQQLRENQERLEKEQEKIAQENEKIEKMRKENEAKQVELKKFEEKRKNQEQELLSEIQKHNDTPNKVADEKKDITEDQFFDDFFNDDDEG